MGAPAKPELQEKKEYEGISKFDWERPFESIEDGCPGGWIYNIFVLSLSKYLRQSSEAGIWSSNRFLEMTEDRVIIAAVNYYEYECRRFRNYHAEMMDYKQKQLIANQNAKNNQ